MNKSTDIITEAQNILKKAQFDHMVQTGNGFRRVDRQVNQIVKLAKHTFRWKRKALFNYIMQTCPDLKSQLSDHEIKYYDTSALYRLMSKAQKSKVIQRLDQIKKRNLIKNKPCL